MSLAARWLQPLHPHRPFLYLLILFVQLRLFTVLLFRPGGWLAVFSDFPFYLELARLTDRGLWPYLHYWSEYPPLFPFLSAALYRLTLRVPPTPEPGFWFYLAHGALMVLADAATLVFLYRLATRLVGRDQALVPCLLYAFLFAPLYILTSWFDPLATALLMAGLDQLAARRWRAAGFLAGLGALVKVFPGLVLPVALKSWREGGRRRAAPLLALLVAFTVPVAVTLLPLYLASPGFTLASLQGMLRRSSWETVWALLEGYYWVGVAGGDRLDPSQAGVPFHPARLPWGLLNVLFALGYLALWARRLRGTGPRPLLAFAGLSLHYLLLVSKGWSPQYLSWLLPLLVLLLPPGRAILYALVLSVLAFLEAPFYLVLLVERHGILWVTVLGRTLVLLLVALEYAAQAYTLPALSGQLRRVAIGVAAAFALLVLAGTPLLAQSYWEVRRAGLPHSAVLAVVEEASPQGTVLVAGSDRALGALFPLAPAGIQVVRELDEASLEEARRLGDLWICALEGPLRTARPEGWEPVAGSSLGPCLLRHLRPAGATGYRALEPAVTVGELARLAAVRTEVEERGLRVHLLWEVTGQASGDYTVFVHLLAPGQERPASQRDGPPCQGLCPTGRWAPGEVVEDVRRVDWPPGGDVDRLAVGLYDPLTLERLPLFRGGERLPDDRLVLPRLELP